MTDPTSRRADEASVPAAANGRREAGTSGDGGRPVRIVYVSRFGGGGAMTGLLDLLRALDGLPYEPTVLLLEESPYADELRRLGARVIHAASGSRAADRIRGIGPLDEAREHPAGGWIRSLPPYVWTRRVETVVRRDLREARRLKPILAWLRPDLVHHNNNPSANRPSILAARMAGLRQVAHVRSFPTHVALVDPAIGLGVAAYVSMSRALDVDTRRGLHLPAKKSRLIYDPFELDAYVAADARREALRAELGVAPDQPLVVNVGRIVPWKGQDVFLRALGPVFHAHPRAHAVIVGSAAGGEADPYLRGLKRWVRASGYADRVTFTGFRRDVPDLLAAADMVVHSSSEPEPFGRVVVEAMAAGRPVVATDGGGVPDIVEDGRTGRLVPLGDARALAAALLDLLAEPERREAMGRAARASVSRRFSVDRFAGEIDGLYREVLNREPARSLPRRGARSRTSPTTPRPVTPSTSRNT